MRIVVLVKPVPDPASAGERLGPDGRLDRAAVPAVVNGNDEYVLEAALKLIEAAGDGEITRSAAIVASWARYARGVDEDGEEIEIVDRRADRLRELARDDDPLAFIRNRELFGDLGDDERFASAYRSALESLREHEARSTLERLAE